MENKNDRMPPFDKSAEQRVLGALLRDNVLIGDVLQIIDASHFYAVANKLIFGEIVHLWDQGRNVDSAILADVLHARGKVDEIGGLVYLNKLWEEASPGNAEYYAQIIRGKAIQRGLIHAGEAVTKIGLEPSGPADEMVELAEREIFEVGEMGLQGTTVDLTSAVGQAVERIDRRSQGRQAGGLPTGFIDLDNILGGFQPSELCVIAARPSVGKTALAQNLALHALMQEDAGIFFSSLEQSSIELADRFLSILGRVNSHHLRLQTLNQEEYARISQAKADLWQRKMFIDDGAFQPVMRISANGRRLKRRHNIGLVLIDYLQLIQPTDRRTPRHEQVGEISRRLKELAKELKIPVVVMAQLNRASEDRAGGKPRLADLRESGEIECNADVVILLHRVDRDSQIIEVDVAKNRNGRTGPMKLVFERECLRFSNCVGE